METRQIGGIEFSSDSRGVTYRITYLADDEGVAALSASPGDPVSWAPERAELLSFEKKWVSPDCWLISLSARNALSDDEGGESVNPLDYASYVEKSLGNAEIYFPIEWWGMRRAGLAEAGFAGLEQLERTIDNAFYDVKGQRVLPGGMLFPDADLYSYGKPDFSACPFSNPSISTMPVLWHGQRIVTRVYICSFYTSRDFSGVSAFSGVSGAFGDKCRPPDGTAGKWKSESQTLKSVRDRYGKYWTKVTRKMIAAPGALLWDPAKNGGTWSW